MSREVMAFSSMPHWNCESTAGHTSSKFDLENPSLCEGGLLEWQKVGFIWHYPPKEWQNLGLPFLEVKGLTEFFQRCRQHRQQLLR